MKPYQKRQIAYWIEENADDIDWDMYDEKFCWIISANVNPPIVDANPIIGIVPTDNYGRDNENALRELMARVEQELYLHLSPERNEEITITIKAKRRANIIYLPISRPPTHVESISISRKCSERGFRVSVMPDRILIFRDDRLPVVREIVEKVMGKGVIDE